MTWERVLFGAALWVLTINLLALWLVGEWRLALALLMGAIYGYLWGKGR